jgi:hypothetical protein
MMALDFFLYDNRTWSPRLGRDWGLKAATGVLADRADLKAAFDRYCGAMPSDQGQLYGFGEAIGGLRSQTREGYLLCVTLESSDSFGRPSWAVFGLWCSDSSTLEQTLSDGDPVGSARALLGVETPPKAIEIRPATIEVGQRRRRRASTEPSFYRFDPNSTVREVTSLLLGMAQDRAKLANVLGITATSRLTAVAQMGFNVVYCHPMEDRTERALARVLSPQEPELNEAELPPGESPVPQVDRQIEIRSWTRPPSRPPEPRSSILILGLFGLSIGVLAAVIISLLVDNIRRDPSAHSQKSSPRVEQEVSASGDTAAPEPSAPEKRSAEAVLDKVKARLEECKQLVPGDLRGSPGFNIAETRGVLPGYEDRRQAVRDAYSGLIEIRGRIVGGPHNYVAYYFDEAGKGLASATRLQKITEIFGSTSLGRGECEIIKNAFGFELENRDSVVRQWCDTLGRLEETAIESGLKKSGGEGPG